MAEKEDTQPPVTRSEAIDMLSRQLRKTDDPGKLVKLLTLHAKLSGWKPTPQPGLSDEESLARLVEESEKRRKNEVQ